MSCLTGAGCDEPPPPPRATYLAVWSDALEVVIRTRALAGGSEGLATPADGDPAALDAALTAARRQHGIDDAAWTRALLHHERDTRDEIHVRTSDLVHGWSQVARNPVGTVGRVLGESTEAALTAGWAPPQSLHEASVTASFRVSYEPVVDDPRPPGLKQTLEAALPLDDVDAALALEGDLATFRATTSEYLQAVLAALPPERLQQTLSDQRLTDGMWEHALQRFGAAPRAPVVDGELPPDKGYSMLTEVNERVAEVEELARLVDAWWAAGDATAADRWVGHCRDAARDFLMEQMHPETEAEAPRRLPTDPTFATTVQDQVAEALDLLSRVDVSIRMLRLRQAGPAGAAVQDMLAAEMAGARATAELPTAEVVALIQAAVAAAGPPEGPAFLARFELRNQAITEGLERAAEAAGVAPTLLPYLRWRVEVERTAVEAFDAAIAQALAR